MKKKKPVSQRYGMSEVKHICFDLDGTLVDSKNTIYKSTLAALNKLKIATPVPEDKFSNMIGMHFIDIFRQLDVEVPDIELFIKIYKELYFHFISDSILYPDVEIVLKDLNQSGKIISLLTTKAQDQTEKIIDHFKLRNYFHCLMGRRYNIGYKPSPEPLLHICRELGVNSTETLIVGDTELDILCGKNAGAKTCAVIYGYRKKDLLEKERPDFYISGLTELRNYL
ncbi:MAG TPA: HAD family hydrolase [Ignavibacteriaceae bacterium]